MADLTPTQAWFRRQFDEGRLVLSGGRMLILSEPVRADHGPEIKSVHNSRAKP